jgi:hypothetical protein
VMGLGLCPGEIPGRRWRPDVGDVSDAVLPLGGDVEVHPFPLLPCARVKTPNPRIGRRRHSGVVFPLGGAVFGSAEGGMCCVWYGRLWRRLSEELLWRARSD